MCVSDKQSKQRTSPRDAHRTMIPFAFLPFPYLNSLSLLTQFIILIALLLSSYRFRRVRLVLLIFLAIYTTYKVTPLLFRYGPPCPAT
jgi:hypothetical protein